MDTNSRFVYIYFCKINKVTESEWYILMTTIFVKQKYVIILQTKQ